MGKYIVDFQAIINGQQVESGSLGVVGAYNPNHVKNTIIQQYRIRFPQATAVAPHILQVREVSDQEYYDNLDQGNFFEIKVK